MVPPTAEASSFKESTEVKQLGTRRKSLQAGAKYVNDTGHAWRCDLPLNCHLPSLQYMKLLKEFDDKDIFTKASRTNGLTDRHTLLVACTQLKRTSHKLQKFSLC